MGCGKWVVSTERVAEETHNALTHRRGQDMRGQEVRLQEVVLGQWMDHAVNGVRRGERNVAQELTSSISSAAAMNAGPSFRVTSSTRPGSAAI